MSADVQTICIQKPLHKALYLIIEVSERRVSLMHMQNDPGSAIVVLEKYYIRMRARSVATVVFEDMEDHLKVSCVCSGSGNTFEFGANEHFQAAI